MGRTQHIDFPTGKEFQSITTASFAYNRVFYRRWKMEVRAWYCVVLVDSDGLLLVLTPRGKEMKINDLPMTFLRRAVTVMLKTIRTWSVSAFKSLPEWSLSPAHSTWSS